MDGLAPDLHGRYAEVFRFVRRRTSSDSEAEEITQSVFAQAAARLDCAKAGSPPPLAWLYTVAQRRLIDQARRRSSRPAVVPLREAAAESVDRRYGGQVAVALRAALTALPATQREVVVLRLVEGRSFAEIAERLGATEAACKMRFLRGLASVRDVFEKEGIEAVSASTVDVLYEPDLLELLGDEPELLAIADAIAQTQTGSHRRSWLPRAAVASTALAATVALLVAAPWGGGEPSLVERALAAVGEGPVIHAVIASDPQITSIDLATGRETAVAGTTEIWFDGQRRIEHTVWRMGGRVGGEMLQTPSGTVSVAGVDPAGPPPVLDPALAKWVDGYRDALASGEAKPAGEGTIDGHPVEWLELTGIGGSPERVAIDKDTSEPVRVASVPDGAGQWHYDVFSIEALPEGSGDFTPPRPSSEPQPQAFMREPATIAAEDATAVVPGALALGSEFQGLPLTQVLRAKLSILFEPEANRDPIVSSGLEFQYGDHDFLDDRPYVRIEEATQPSPQYGWRPSLLPGPGRLLVVHGAGLMVTNGVYVTIQASDRELMLEAARALRPFS
ncbi:MAG TPA: RNA polymerase sigma factor [Gaiellaceae bacterium]